jgi:hypothetical protein
MPPSLDLVPVLAQHAIPEPNLAMPLRIVRLDPREAALGGRHVHHPGALDTERSAVVAGALELGADSEGRDVKGEIARGPVGIGLRAAPAAGERGNRTSQDAPGADARAPVRRRVVPLAAQDVPFGRESAAESPDLTGPDGLVNLGKRYGAPSVSGDDLACDEIEVTAGLGPGADEDGIVSGLVNLEAPVALRAVGVGKVAGPFTDEAFEGQAC